LYITVCWQWRDTDYLYRAPKTDACDIFKAGSTSDCFLVVLSEFWWKLNNQILDNNYDCRNSRRISIIVEILQCRQILSVISTVKIEVTKFEPCKFWCTVLLNKITNNRTIYRANIGRSNYGFFPSIFKGESSKTSANLFHLSDAIIEKFYWSRCFIQREGWEYVVSLWKLVSLSENLGLFSKLLLPKIYSSYDERK